MPSFTEDIPVLGGVKRSNQLAHAVRPNEGWLLLQPLFYRSAFKSHFPYVLSHMPWTESKCAYMWFSSFEQAVGNRAASAVALGTPLPASSPQVKQNEPLDWVWTIFLTDLAVLRDHDISASTFGERKGKARSSCQPWRRFWRRLQCWGAANSTSERWSHTQLHSQRWHRLQCHPHGGSVVSGAGGLGDTRKTS